ncbi:MAG: CPBP family intramembrane metalloprotease [Acidobacteria bacterium]|nr:CPBP family intramembrane metalloprotease [Acidobacteriota bacterium]
MSAPDSTTTHERTGRAFSSALVLAALAWSFSSRLLSASSALGITNRLNIDWAAPLLAALFLVFLLAVGYSLLDILSRKPASGRQALGLPNRPTALREWLTGAAVGWGIVTFTVLPMALVGDLHVGFWFSSDALRPFLIGLATIAVGTLADEAIFRGYPFRRLIDATGPVTATIVMSLLFALRHLLHFGAGGLAFVLSILTGVVFSVSWFRTHGLWMAWGMRFAWTASMGVLFGLPVSGTVDNSTIIQTAAIGRGWFTGDDYGPEASIVLLFALIAGLIVLVRVTRDYAWNYTHPPVVPGGYPMDIAPPPAHTAMEQSVQAREPALIQILPATPQGRSTTDDPAS